MRIGQSDDIVERLLVHDGSHSRIRTRAQQLCLAERWFAASATSHEVEETKADRDSSHQQNASSDAKAAISLTTLTTTDLPPVKPSAIALGTLFNHTASLAILGPLFGDTYNRAQAANSKEEFFKSKEAASAAAAWGSSIVGSAVQSYGVGALINATGTLSYKGAAYLGSLIFMASAAPSVSLFVELFRMANLHAAG